MCLGVLSGRADQWIYTDQFQNGWENWSFFGVYAASTAVVHSGSYSIEATLSGSPMNIGHNPYPFDATGFGSLNFSINGGATGGQQLEVVFSFVSGPAVVSILPPLATNAWQDISISLTSPVMANRPDLGDILILGFLNSEVPTFYVDDIKLVTIPEPRAGALFALSGLIWILARRRKSRGFSPATG